MPTDAPRSRNTRGEESHREILAHAVDVASAEGIEGLTIGRLAGDLGMSKAGLFAHFGSKEGLQLAVVDAARDIFETEVVDRVEGADEGIAALDAMLDAWAAYVEESRFYRGGCFFAAAAAEFDDRPGPVRERVAALTRVWYDALEEQAARAVSLRQFRKEIDPAQFAFEVHAMVQEANLSWRLLGDKQAFVKARRGMLGRIELAATKTGLKALGAKPRLRRGW